jgi:hypothetical protein
MRILFVYWAFEDQGSGLVLAGYAEAARALGHEAAVYGCWRLGEANPQIPLNYSLDVASADAVVFLFEWTTALKPGDQLDLVRLVGKVPRRRRVIIDGDGKYNDVIRSGEEENHEDEASCRHWVDVCDSLADKICQPTLQPLRPNVLPFLFYAYNPAWAVPPDFRAKEFSLLYVGHSKYRWGPMGRVLGAVEPVRDRLGRIGLVGHGWGSPPWWADRLKLERAYFTDPGRLERLGVEVLAPVRFSEVIGWMSKATVNAVLLRPLFAQLRFVTPRLFETAAANTIPLFVLEPAHARAIYGEAAMDLVLPEDGAAEKVLDLVRRPERYVGAVREIRQHLAEKHSHAARLRRLIEIIES